VLYKPLVYAKRMTIAMSESRQHLLDFLEHNKVGVLATANNLGKPHAATVYVTFDQDLNLYFLTRTNTQKSRNIQSNNQVALAIYNAPSQTTLQAEGTAVEVTDPSQVQWITNDIWRVATQTSPDTQPPQAQLTGAGYYAVYKLLAPSLRLATYAHQNSAKAEQVFSIVPTRKEEHFNGFDKNTN